MCGARLQLCRGDRCSIVMAVRGWLFYLSGRASDAIPIIVGGITAYRSTGATQSLPVLLSSLASAYAEMGKFEDAQRCIDEAIVAIETTKEKWFEADINRLAREIALESPELSATTAEAYFERALAARYGASIAQVSLRSSAAAKSWGTPRRSEHGAGLWRNQGKRDQAKLASFSLPSTAGSPRGSIRSI